MKYNIIYADPPWQFGDRMLSKGHGGYFYSLEDKHYTPMNYRDICHLGIELRPYLADDSALFMWSTDAHLKEAIDVMESWGLTYTTVAFYWLKQEKSGKDVCFFGRWTMKSMEICLLGKRGKPQRYGKNVRQLLRAERGTHSQKPSEIRGRIVELMGDLPRIELFARQKVDGWDCWGNEVESDIEL